MVKLVALYVTKNVATIDISNEENFIYDQKIQLELHKRYLKNVNPEKYGKKKKAKREEDVTQNKDEKRRLQQNELDRKRNKTETSAAKKLHLSKYEETDVRILYRNFRENKKNHDRLVSSLKTETGFDVICSCCLKYKLKSYCKPVKILSKAKVKKFILNICSLLKNRTDGQFVCNLCLRDINKNKTPK